MATDRQIQIELAPTKEATTFDVNAGAEGQENGCINCVVEYIVEDFWGINRGDHIAMPGMIPFYKHHAIVDNIEDISADGQSAVLTIIDVAGKGKVGYRRSYPVTKHPLCRKDNQQEDRDNLQEDRTNRITLSSHCFQTPVNREFLWKVHYRKRKFNEENTFLRANSTITDQSGQNIQSLKYNFCMQNCEHFASTMVNGPTRLDREAPKEGVSLQLHTFLSVILTLLIWLGFSIFYILDLTAYALLVKNDKGFTDFGLDFFVKEGLLKTCFVQDNSSDSFWARSLDEICEEKTQGYFYNETSENSTTPDTTIDCEKSWFKCHWIYIIIFGGAFILAMLLQVGAYYYRKKVCFLCLFTLICTITLRLILVFVIIWLNNSLPMQLYEMILANHDHTKGVAILIIIFVAAGTCTLIYSVPSLLLKGVYWMLGMCNNTIDDYNSYVPWRGLFWPLRFFDRRKCFYRRREHAQ